MTDKEFAPVPISKIKPNEALITDIYLKVNSKFIKFKHQGDDIPGEKYQEFLAKSLKEVFIHIEQVPTFITWLASIKEKSIDENLRVGKNILRPTCDTIPGDQFKPISDSKVDTIESKVSDTNYYNSFMASGDSGGPAIIDNKVVGVFCSIKSFHSYEGTRFVNLITPTYSKSLRGFWLNNPESVKTFR